jgi:hypothetical protein
MFIAMLCPCPPYFFFLRCFGDMWKSVKLCVREREMDIRGENTGQEGRYLA